MLEAMALGLVPLVVNYAGPAELVTASTGFKIPLGQRSDIVAGFRLRLREVAAERSGLGIMGEAARVRVGDYFTWEAFQSTDK